MDGSPVTASPILGIPVNKIPGKRGARILKGGTSVHETAGISVVGNHYIDSPEPICGFAVINTTVKA